MVTQSNPTDPNLELATNWVKKVVVMDIDRIDHEYLPVGDSYINVKVYKTAVTIEFDNASSRNIVFMRDKVLYFETM